MSSKRSSRSGSQAPRLHVAPRADESYGDVAAEFSARFGLTPDPWQRLILDDWLAMRRGMWAARNCGLSVPRQNGKNAVLEVRELFGTVLLGEKILHTAHEVKTAKKHFRRLQHFFGTQRNDPRAKFPELNALVADVRKVNGEEAIVLTNGGSIEMAARSKSSGRGFTVDIVVFDEAQQLDDDALEALAPTKSSGPLGNPQVIYTGTPPGPNAQGEVFTRQRAAALAQAKAPKSRCWHEWSKAGRVGKGEGEIDLDDRNNWYDTNPALGSSRMPLEIAEDDREDLSDGGFARERLGMWAEDDPDLARVIAADLWATLEAKTPPADGVAPNALGLDASHDRVIAIAGCWVDGDKAHVELVRHERSTDTLAAVEWLVANAGRRIPVVVDSASPAAAMVPALTAAKVKVVTTSATDMGKACGLILADATEKRLTHADQQQLNSALAGARKRDIRDAGMWGWDRKNPDTDIAPLVAATLARYGASTNAKPKSGRAVFA